MNFLLAILLASSLEETVEPEVSIARVYLQPIGMPVVSVYHNIKENVFLNTRCMEGAGLEAIGDFFLAPSRYLFGGQDISIKTRETYPSFSYGKYDWAKTTLSLLALPLSELVGCAFKGAALLSNETKEHYRVIHTSIWDNQVVSQLPLYLEKGIEAFHSDEIAPCLGCERPSILSRTHQIEIEAFKEICQLLDENGIVYWLDCGTCLGAFRYGGMIPWDDDIDIAILSEDHDNVKKALRKLDPNQFQVQDWSSYRYPKTFLKLYLKETKTLIDIYHYNLDEKNRMLTYFYSYKDSPLPASWKQLELVMTKPLPYETIFPLKRTSLDGIPTWAPRQIEAFLKTKYGENLLPTMVWDAASQSYKKVKNHPYWQLFSLQHSDF